MRIFKSVCSNLFFPKSRMSIDAFRETAAFLAAHGIQGMEFYHDGDGPHKVGAALADHGLDGVYIAVIPLKERSQHLCALDDENRRSALNTARLGMDLAADNGLGCVMVNSGRIEPGKLEDQLEALENSFERLFDYGAQRGYRLNLEMEPCDSVMDARQLIGPWRRTQTFVRRLNEKGLPLKLTMDTAHTVEEGEDFLEALRAVRPWCSHVHYANCLIEHPEDPLYGDKHLGYDYPETVWNFKELEALTDRLEALYPKDTTLKIGLEALCREDDPFAWFNDVWRKMSFMRI